MKDCEKCGLRLRGRYFAPDLFRNIPLHLRHIFICDNEDFISGVQNSLQQQKSLCPRDLWVLTFIGNNEPFAVRNAANTLDQLVQAGAAELLCNLFENASYEVRRELWLRMTKEHPQRLYLFDAIFEKHCLAPVESADYQQHRQLYQYSLLFANSASPALFEDLY